MFMVSSIKILPTFQSPVLMLPSAQSLTFTPSQDSHPPYLFPLVDPVCFTIADIYAYSITLPSVQHSLLGLSENHFTRSEDAKGKFAKGRQANWRGATFCSVSSGVEKFEFWEFYAKKGGNRNNLEQHGKIDLIWGETTSHQLCERLLEVAGQRYDNSLGFFQFYEAHYAKCNVCNLF